MSDMPAALFLSGTQDDVEGAILEIQRSVLIVSTAPYDHDDSGTWIVIQPADRLDVQIVCTAFHVEVSE